jgi:hypothetical protein
MHVLTGNYKSDQVHVPALLDTAGAMTWRNDRLRSAAALARDRRAGALAALIVGFALWRGLSGWPCAAAAGLPPGRALAQPVLQVEDRAPLSDIVLMVVDQRQPALVGPPDQTAEAADTLEAEVAASEHRGARVTVGDGRRCRHAADDGPGRCAGRGAARPHRGGAILVTDGQLHDAELVPGPARADARAADRARRLGPPPGDRKRARLRHHRRRGDC